MRYFESELARALKSRGTFFTMVLIFSLFAICVWQFYGSFLFYKGYALYFFFLLYSPLTVFAPIIAILPFAGSYLHDKENGFLWGVINRSNIQRYWRTKFWSVGITGALALMIPLIILLIVNLAIFGNHHASFGDLTGPFVWLYNTHQDFWLILITILHSGLFGFIYANLGLVVSLYIPKSYAVVGFPFLIYLVPAFVFPFLGLSQFEPSATFIFYASSGSTYTSVYGELILVLILVMLAGYWRIRRPEKWLL